MNNKILLRTIVLCLVYFPVSFSQSIFSGIDFDTVKAQKFDMGKMWTFENPPLDYFDETYNFRPTEEWMDKVQKSALKFGGGCSASFVTEDGLIMTNHHCIRGTLAKINNEGEDLLKNGFYAETIEHERKIPGLSVRQLMLIEDVTDEIQSAMNSVESDSAKVAARNEKINEIKERNLKINPQLEYSVTSLYYGGKYSLYGFKKYNDVRLVFVPELFVAKLGGDPDNFTYPRYGLDCAFLRAYDENGKPIKTDYYFSWSTEPITEDQPVFVVGNPGSTNRIFTAAQLVFIRDYQYGLQTPMRTDLYAVYEKLVNAVNAEDTKLIASLYSTGNGLKVYSETYKALLDPVFMARKKDFENKFKEAVQSDEELNKKYGQIWDEIAKNRKEASVIANEIYAYTVSSYFSPKYLFIAQNLVKLAEKLKLPSEERSKEFQTENIDSLVGIFFPAEIDPELEKGKLLVQLNVWKSNLPADSEIILKMFNGKSAEDAVDYLLANSKIKTKAEVVELAKAGADAIYKSDDPFIYFIMQTKDKLSELQKKNRTLEENDAVNNQLLGEALYYVYGDKIPPDATGTLRISDGVVKGYDYNGTRAPYKTTFYGSLDRYYSFNKKFPFNLPEYWENLPDEFDLSTTFDFVSTNDIIGGNSGSPVLNINAEVVGLAFDGNIESHSGRFIYTTEANRTVSVSAEGMIEAIKDVYRAERLASEIINGKVE